MSQQKLTPVPMSKDELIEILTDITNAVKEGDSWEGSIQYLIPFPPAGDPKDADFMVQGSVRFGNSMGQGGISLIGEWKEVIDEPATEN